MSQLFEVFTHPSGRQWGYATASRDGQVTTASLAPNGAITRERCEPIWLAPAIQQHLRNGFRQADKPKYLRQRMRDGAAIGEFVAQHPDLDSGLAGERLFFAVLPDQSDIAAMAAAWRQRLSGTVEVDGRAAWLAHCAQATAYVPALSTDAAAALLLAQAAREQGWLVLAEAVAALPLGVPNDARDTWRDYLGHWFEAAVLQTAFEELGWPLSWPSGSATRINTTPQPADEGEWIAIAQQVSF